MSSRLRAFAKLSPARRRALASAVWALLRARLVVRLASLDRMKRWALSTGTGAMSQQDAVWAMEKAYGIAPASTCLCKAIAMQHLLSKNGHVSELKIGVQLAGGDFSAHAWLEADGQILVGAESAADHHLLTGW